MKKSSAKINIGQYYLKSLWKNAGEKIYQWFSINLWSLNSGNLAPVDARKFVSLFKNLCDARVVRKWI